MSIRHQIARGYVFVLGLALVGTTTGLLVGRHFQSQALMAQEVAIAERNLLSNLQVKILYNRPTKQLSPHLGSWPGLQAASTAMLDRTVVIQALLENRKQIEAVKQQLPDIYDTPHDQNLQQLLNDYETALLKFQDRIHVFTQAVKLTYSSASDQTEAQTLLITFVQSPEFANFVRLPDELVPIVEIVEQQERAASEALANAIALQTQIIAASLLLSTVIAAIMAQYTSRAIASPIQRVTGLAHRITHEQNFDLQMPVLGRGEVASLAHSFNQLLAQVKQLLAQIGQKNSDLESAMTQLHRQQVQLVQSEKMSSLGQLVAGMAHEINNPVNFIHGNLVHVQRDVQALLSCVQLYQTHCTDLSADIQLEANDIDIDFIQDDLPKIIVSMRKGTQRIREIILSLRTFSRMDESEVKKVDIHEGLDSTLSLLHHRLTPEHGQGAIAIRKDYDQLPLVECAAGHLNQVFMNILLNAIDALTGTAALSSAPAEIPAEITVRTSSLGEDWVQIEIADNGPGMTEAVKSRLFEPFFTTKPVGKGTGMGMSLSYQIMTDQHGGKLDCCSAPGEGTAIILQLPCTFGGVSKPA